MMRYKSKDNTYVKLGIIIYNRCTIVCIILHKKYMYLCVEEDGDLENIDCDKNFWWMSVTKSLLIVGYM